MPTLPAGVVRRGSVQPWRRQRFRQFAEVRETGDEAKKVNDEGDGCVQFDYLCGCEAVQGGYMVQVGTKFTSIAGGNLQFPRLREVRLVEPIEMALQDFLKLA